MTQRKYVRMSEQSHIQLRLLAATIDRSVPSAQAKYGGKRHKPIISLASVFAFLRAINPTSREAKARVN